MDTCRDCGAPIQWLKTESGKMAPFDVQPRIHFASCKKRQKPQDSDAVGYLVSLGYKKTEARQMVAGKKGTVEEIVKEALKDG